MRERIVRGDYWADLVYGYGRLQRASHILSSNLPEAVKRHLTANPDIADDDAFKDVPLDEILLYQQSTEPEIVRLVLQNASDWKKEEMTVEEYVDDELPYDVAQEIVARVKAALARLNIPPEKKSLST